MKTVQDTALVLNFFLVAGDLGEVSNVLGYKVWCGFIVITWEAACEIFVASYLPSVDYWISQRDAGCGMPGHFDSKYRSKEK